MARMGTGPLTLLAEGWRYHTHSLAMVHQYQCRELLWRDDVHLYHRDAPRPVRWINRWRQQWKKPQGLLSEADEDLVRSVPNLPDGERPDVNYRIFYPYDFRPASTGRTAVFAVTEYQILNPIRIRNRQRLDAAIADNDVLLITPSQYSKQGLLNTGVPEHRVHVVPHGFDEQIFHPPDPDQRSCWRKEADIDNAFVFLAVGTMYEYKGILELMRGLAVVAQKHPHVRLIMKGIDSAYKSKQCLSDMIQQLTTEEWAMIQPRMQYIGQMLPPSQIARLYQTADILMAPSSGEGFNLPVLEASACGLPTICTGGGPTDEFTDKTFVMRIDSTPEPLEKIPGFRLQPRYDHLVELMFKAVEDEVYIRGARDAGPAHVAPIYTWERVVNQLVRVLRG